jgi:hypothetical protein
MSPRMQTGVSTGMSRRRLTIVSQAVVISGAVTSV